MTLETTLAFLGGAAPTHVLRSGGVSQWEINRGVDDGRALRIRRGVLALPDTPPELVTAVREHARLTCISAATYYGLWRVREPAEVHLSRLERTAADCVNHWSRSVAVHERLPVVEIDGAAYHSDRRSLGRDRLRNNAAVASGYTVLRFTYEDVMFCPQELLALVLKVLAGPRVR